MKPIACILLLTLSIISAAQIAEPKFGDVDKVYLEMGIYDKDTTAGALMLFDNGRSKFTLNSEQAFQFVYERHLQLKIFKKSAFDIADVSIRLYQSGTSKEKLDGLKAVTYNLVDGKVVETKLKTKDVFRTEDNKYINVTFAFPDVREGSVIELYYSITSNLLYNLRGWTFQYSYPALWSQYFYEIPEYFDYRESGRGYLNYDVQKVSTGVVTYTIPTNVIVRTDQGSRVSSAGPDKITVNARKSIYAVKNVPPFKDEPNIDCRENYIQALEFELSSISFPGQPVKNYAQSWESVNTQMKDDEDFGKLLKTAGFINDTVKVICKGTSDELEMAGRIYSYVQKRMKWNGQHKLWALEGLKKPYNDMKGNSAEINLLLTLMLQTAGLRANPVLFSTRDNGSDLTYYPSITKFNSVMTRVEIGGKEYLMDATSKYCPFGTLPAENINGKGRIVNESNGGWVNLEAREIYREKKNYDLSIDPEGRLSGSITGTYGGYAGVANRSALKSGASLDDYYRKMQENNKGLVINKYSVTAENDISRELKDSLSVEISDNIEVIGDRIMFNPLLFERIGKNRFTLEDRKYPVNYNYPSKEEYIFNYTLPSGYSVESLPGSGSFRLPDNSISFSYTVNNSGNKLMISFKREINKMIFSADDYKKLKELYNQIVTKHSEQIILKKTT